MVKQKSVAAIHPITLPVIHCDPVAVELRNPIWTARVKRCAFSLRRFLHEPVELTCAGLIDPCLLSKSKQSYCFQDAKCAKGIAVCCVFGCLKADCYVALGTKVVDLIRLNLLDDPDQVAAIGEVSVMQNQLWVLFVRVLIEVVDAAGVEAAGSALDAMHLVSLLQEQLS